MTLHCFIDLMKTAIRTEHFVSYDDVFNINEATFANYFASCHKTVA